MAKSAGSALIPVLRSELQARLLAALLLNPGREASITELASEVGANTGNVHTEVERLVGAGILADRRVGRTRLLRDAGGVLSRPLAEILTYTHGPKPILEQALAGVADVVEAYVFGSWAARYRGEPGPAPHDIDVLVIGAPDRDVLHEAMQQAGRRLHREVQVAVRTPEAWASADDGFAATVKARPLVQLQISGDLA